MKQSIIARIKSYFTLIIKFFDFDNLMMKFMMTSSQDSIDKS